MSVSNEIHFKMMSLIHDNLYRLFRDPYKALRAAGLKPGQRVLEVGCGPGFFTLPAAEMVGDEGSVCALDINPLAIESVMRKVNEAGRANVQILLADAADTGLPQESFDLIFLFGFRRSVGDMSRILPELHRLLKPAGVLSTEGNLWNSSDLFEPADREGSIYQFTKIA